MSRLNDSRPEIIDVYDFDKTVYWRDSSLDFYMFCVGRWPWLLIYLPYQCWHLLCFRLGRESRTQFKQGFFIFLRSVPDISSAVENFWSGYARRIKDWYRKSRHDSDVIISASPEFLLQPICDQLGVLMLIATRMDKQTGCIDGENCRGEEKVRRLRETLPNTVVRKAYSDSLSDLPLLTLAKEPFVVTGPTITPLKSYKKHRQTKHHFSLPDAIE